MAYNIRKNWLASFDLMRKRPIVILPFFIIAFLEGLALELIFFFPRKPLINIAGPVVRKFFGQSFLRYPGNLILLPRLFYYAQVMIYVFCGVFLAAICVNVARHSLKGLALPTGVLIKTALKRYPSFFIFGVIAIVSMALVKRAEMFVFSELIQLAGKSLPQILLRLSPFILTSLLFLSNIILQTFLVLTVPIIVIRNKSIFKALGQSIKLGWRNFISIFTLIFLPLLLYLPILLLETDSAKLIANTFPEINLYIVVAGIILAAFVECFVIVCATQFLVDREEVVIRV